MLSEGWECYFRDPIVQNLSGEHAPGPPKQLAPSALVIVATKEIGDVYTQANSTEDWFSFQIKTVKHLGCFLVGGRPFLT